MSKKDEIISLLRRIIEADNVIIETLKEQKKRLEDKIARLTDA